MDNLPFGDEEYDVIWSEGAILPIPLKVTTCSAAL